MHWKFLTANLEQFLAEVRFFHKYLGGRMLWKNPKNDKILLWKWQTNCIFLSEFQISVVKKLLGKMISANMLVHLKSGKLWSFSSMMVFLSSREEDKTRGGVHGFW